MIPLSDFGAGVAGRIVLGSGLRWSVEQVGEAKAILLKKILLQRLMERSEGPVRSIETNAIYGIARKSPDDRSGGMPASLDKSLRRILWINPLDESFY
jgi:hypothetical protein